MSRGASAWDAWPSAARLCWDIAVHAPGPVATTLAITLLNGARNGLYAWLTAGVINGLVSGHGAVGWSAWFAAVLTMENLSWTFIWPARDWLRDVAVLRVQERVLRRAAAAPLLAFSDPEWVDRLSRASGDLGGRMGQWLRGVFDLLGAITQVAGMLLAVLALGGGFRLVAVLGIASLVGVFCQDRLARVELLRSQRLARPRRLATAWSGLLTARAAAAEVRLFDLGGWVAGRWEQAYRVCALEDVRTALRRLGWEGLSTGTDLAAYVAVLVLAGLAASHAGPARAAGVFAALLEAAVLMQGFFSNLLGAAGGMHEHGSFVADLAPLLFTDEPSGEGVPAVRGQGWAGARSPAVVDVDGVRFRYPAAAAGAEALRGVSARIAPGEVVALVGPNGAGKSTLAALILGLLPPGAGSVRVDGVTPVCGQSSGAAVFQDFVRFTLPLRDNVGFGQLDRREDAPALRQALETAGSRLAAEDLELWLGPEFEGRDLSGGEWLRVAIARGVLGASGLIVLDEPTAALDPLGEVEIVRRMLALGRDRTAIVVSHRLGIARAADRILVLDEGRVAEEGRHADLLAAGGLYARMWRAQASWYAQGPAAGTVTGD